MLYNDTAAELIKDAFGLKEVREGTFLAKKVSRKKDFLPNILSILDGSELR